MRKPGDTGSSTEEKSRVVDHASSSSNWNETAEYRSDLWSSSWSGWLELHVLHIIPQFYEWSNVSYQTFEWGDSTFVQALISSTNSCTIIWVCFVSVLFFFMKICHKWTKAAWYSTHTFTHHHTTILTTSAGHSATCEAKKSCHEKGSCSYNSYSTPEMVDKTEECFA